jgi:hypothetical protein
MENELDIVKTELSMCRKRFKALVDEHEKLLKKYNGLRAAWNQESVDDVPRTKVGDGGGW